jgi:plastocyanin
MGGAALAVVLVATPAPAAEVPVGVADNMFVPAQVTVQAGDTVTWEQTGDNPHSVTSDDEAFDSHPMCPPVCMQSGGTFQHQFDEPGRFAYHCRIHGGPGGQGMSGVVVVEAAAAQATTTSAPPGGAAGTTPATTATTAPTAVAGTSSAAPSVGGALANSGPTPAIGGTALLLFAGTVLRLVARRAAARD